MNRLLWHWDGRLVISYGEVMAGYAYIKGMAGFRNYGAAGIHWGHPFYIYVVERFWARALGN